MRCKIIKYRVIAVGLVLAFFLPVAGISQATFRTFNKLVVYDSARKALSLEYMKEHYGMVKKEPTINPVMIVLHWTAQPTLESTYDFFYLPTLSASRSDIQSAGDLNVSSQYLIDRDGTIFRLMPDTMFARHVIGLNYCAIGVENVGSEKHPLTAAQLDANEQLIRYLKGKYPIEYVIGHYEYQLFAGTPLWKELNADYRTAKIDPGRDFMEKIRKRIKDLNLKGAPSSNN